MYNNIFSKSLVQKMQCSDRRKLANAIRVLTMDAVQEAKSGHPGAPMGMADIAEVLWNSHLKYNPKNPKWINRDRFILSNGHGSMLLYSLLHLTGFDLSIEEIKNFRQLHSKTPGHPEYGYTEGVETTTGPLGQGLANAVGMAIAERTLANIFNKENYNIIDHFTYVFMGDGCLMEGISHESCALAGTLGLGKLIVFWDDNDISIDGHINDWMEKDVASRFKSYNWDVIENVDGHDAKAVNLAINKAKSNIDKPTLICTKTIIGFGSPNLAGTHECHGAALGEEEICKARQALSWEYPKFEIPKSIYKCWDHTEKGLKDEQKWQQKFINYEAKYPQEAKELKRRLSGELPDNFSKNIDKYIIKTQKEMANIASRKASQNTIEEIAKIMPDLFGGSADLTCSNLTNWPGSININKENANGNYISWGVREFGMAAMMNGITLHGGFKVYGGTFLMFMEYMHNAIRMSALMKIGTIYVYTHDSIGLGEDGPTHQAVEQISNLRVIPNFHTWRACDAVESAVSWKMALLRKNAPTGLIFSRQNLETIQRNKEQIANIEKGGYIIQDCQTRADIILIATGSEVSLALNAAKEMTNINIRIVSMPCTNLFDEQEQAYKDSVLTKGVKRVAIEAGVGDLWYKYVGLEGAVVAMSTFGESAPAKKLFKHFGFTVNNVINTINSLLD